MTLPSSPQLHTLDLGIVAIIHFGLNTFTDKEWGFGDVSPECFNPAQFDAQQWVDAAKAGGIRRIILVCKHHDGFCLWPSKFNNDYTIANSSWQRGKGDVVRDVHDAAIKAGLEFAAYLSPWDRHQAEYARPAYVEYYHSQWNELMDTYGPISEIWLDGANGGDGWYGGTPEKRILPKPAHDYYEYERLHKELLAKNPQAVVFGGIGNQAMVWPGNEKGFVPDDYVYDDGQRFRPPECDTPLRQKWFWHKDDAAKPLDELVTRYFQSVGRGGILDLGLSPNDQGLLDDGDVERLRQFGIFVRSFNALDIAADADITVSDNKMVYTYNLKTHGAFNAVDFKEDLTQGGMRIRAWRFEADGKTLAQGTAAGFRRIERFPLKTASQVRLVITECDGTPAIAGLALRHATEFK